MYGVETRHFIEYKPYYFYEDSETKYIVRFLLFLFSASDQTVVYDEINQQMTLYTEVSKDHKSVSTDHGDHYDIMDVAMQSSVNDG